MFYQPVLGAKTDCAVMTGGFNFPISELNFLIFVFTKLSKSPKILSIFEKISWATSSDWVGGLASAAGTAVGGPVGGAVAGRVAGSMIGWQKVLIQ